MPKSRKAPGRIYKRYNRDPTGEKVFHTLWTIRLKGKDHPTGTSDYKIAQRQLFKLIGELGHEKRRELQGAEGLLMISDLLQLVISDYEREGKSNLRTVRIHIKLHLQPALGQRRAAELTKDDVDGYMDARVAAGASKATINREISVLQRGYSLAIEKGRLKFAPVIKRFTEDNARTGFLRPEQYLVLMQELPPYLRPVLCVGYRIGDRSGELLSMKRSQVDFINREIDLDPGSTKNKEGRTAPIYGDMGKVLGDWMDESASAFPECPWVFHKDGEPMLTFRKAWDSACTRAGVPDLLFHDLRRSAVRNLSRAGVPQAIAMKISGHKTDSIYRRYNIVDAADVRLAGKLMDAFAASDKES